MKRFLKHIVAFGLALLARAIVRRYHPRIVMITGSVGKTSTKDAVAAVLSTSFFVRKSEKSFNSEFGVPFTIFGVENPWNNPLAWFSLVKRAFALMFLPNQYPNMLVLEVGADRPGDLARILRIATPDAVVVTRLPEVPVHVEAYVSPEAVRDEEFSPAYALAAEAPLIISADDPYAVENALRTPARTISYGSVSSATVRLSNIDFFEQEGRVAGMQGHISIGSEECDVVVKGSIGATQVYPAAAALAVAGAFEVPLEIALKALEGYDPPPGRGRLLAGKNDTIIIDDSYNSSPAAVEQALETLKHFPHAKHPHSAEASKGRRIAVLGDMLELGRYSVEEHERIGALARASADLVATVGIRSRTFANAPGKAEVVSFDNARAAATELATLIQPGDVILVKGSQSIRTEYIVKSLLANATDVSLLVRQEKKWLKK